MADWALPLSFAQNLKTTENTNLSFRYQRQSDLSQIGALPPPEGFGLDAGLQYRAASAVISGVMARDISTPSMHGRFKFTGREKYYLTKTDIPVKSTELTMHPAVKRRLAFPAGKFGEACTAELNDRSYIDGKRNTVRADTVASIHTGLEANIKDVSSFGAGINNFQQAIKGWRYHHQKKCGSTTSAGAGFKLKNVMIDYALPTGNQSNHYTPIYFPHQLAGKTGS